MRDIFPTGVVNVLAGGDELGALMSAHPGIDKISFTGSVATGKKVMASASGSLKRVTLELGGNDAAIVLEDVDVAEVAKKVFFAATVNSGQVCMAIKRVYVHEKIYEAFCTALAAEARNAKLGSGLDSSTVLGPIQNQRQYERVRGFIDDIRKGAGQDPRGCRTTLRRRLFRRAARCRRARRIQPHRRRRSSSGPLSRS